MYEVLRDLLLPTPAYPILDVIVATIACAEQEQVCHSLIDVAFYFVLLKASEL